MLVGPAIGHYSNLRPTSTVERHPNEAYTPDMRLMLPSMTRSIPLRVLAVMACWLMLTNSLWAYVPSALPAGNEVMHHVTEHASNKVHAAQDVQCCPTDAHHAAHTGATCHCVSLCGGLLLPTSETASVTVMPTPVDAFPLERRIRSLVLQPPLRPPVV